MRLRVASSLFAFCGSISVTAHLLDRQVSPLTTRATPLHVVVNKVDLGPLHVNGSTVTFGGVGSATLFILDSAGTGYLYEEPDAPVVGPIPGTLPRAFIDFSEPVSTSTGSTCRISGLFLFATNATNQCESDSPFSFFNNELLYGSPAGPVPVVAGTFQTCDNKQITYLKKPTAHPAAAAPAATTCTPIQIVVPSLATPV